MTTDRPSSAPRRSSRSARAGLRPASPSPKRPGSARTSRRSPRPSSAAGAGEGAAKARGLPDRGVPQARAWSRSSTASFTQDDPRPRARARSSGGTSARCSSGPTRRSRDEWVIVAAHFDHLGVRDGVLYPGADDNASGVAMMLEVARSLVESPEKPRRSVMFVGFDLEEVGLFGSRYFVEHPPVPLDKVALFVTADMIGRSLGGVCDRLRLRHGDRALRRGLRPWIARPPRGKPLDGRPARRRPPGARPERLRPVPRRGRSPSSSSPPARTRLSHARATSPRRSTTPSSRRSAG